MKAVLALALFLLLLPTTAIAAQVYGSLKEGDRPVGKGVIVEVRLTTGESYRGETDEYGSYSIYAGRPGRGTLVVYFRGQWSKPSPIYSYNDPVRYDFDLVPDGNGYSLKRR